MVKSACQHTKLLLLFPGPDSIKAHPDFEEKYKNNQDTSNRELAFEMIFEEVMLKNRRSELDLYKLLSIDAAFKAAMQQSLRQLFS